MRRSLKDILVEYGVVALVVHYTIGALVIVGMYVAITNGLQPRGAVQNAGMWAAVYGAYKASMIVRVPITLFLVPFAAKLYERVTGRRPGPLRISTATPSDHSGPADAA
ncbi:MAG TPA: hypothetical protein VGE02_01020 [Gemmatimonadales bacterium]